MRPFLLIIVTGLVSGVLAFAGAYIDAGEDLWRRLTITSDRLNEVIGREDSPEKLDAILDQGHLGNTPSNFRVFLNTIELNRPNSFKFLFSGISIHPKMSDADKTRLFEFAFQKENVEICDFLLAQKFLLVKSLYSSWHRPLSWDIETLKGLISRHPDRVPELAPSWFLVQLSSTVEHALKIIEFNRHCTTINDLFARNNGFNPTTLIDYVTHNGYFDDADMALMLTRLIEWGGVVNQKLYDNFIEACPRYEATILTLSYALHEDIKEPEMS